MVIVIIIISLLVILIWMIVVIIRQFKISKLDISPTPTHGILKCAFYPPSTDCDDDCLKTCVHVRRKL